MDLLDPAAIAAIAAEARSCQAFGVELLERAARVVGFDVAYHGLASEDPSATPVIAFRGFSVARERQIIADGPNYTAELMPVKAAAMTAAGVAIDSEVFSTPARARLGYFRDVMDPDHGRHAMFVLGLFRGAVVSVTMLGRTGSAFEDADVRAMRRLVPVLGLAAAADAATDEREGRRAADLVDLSDLERDLVDYVALGLTNAEIGQLRGTSPRTVRNQLSALYNRLVVANRAELVAVVSPRGTRSARGGRHI